MNTQVLSTKFSLLCLPCSRGRFSLQNFWPAQNQLNDPFNTSVFRRHPKKYAHEHLDAAQGTGKKIRMSSMVRLLVPGPTVNNEG